jgi:hypothetical protein
MKKLEEDKKKSDEDSKSHNDKMFADLKSKHEEEIMRLKKELEM